MTHINNPVHQVTYDGAQLNVYHANTDYQAYLKWPEEGNTPEPADANPTA